MHVKSDINSLLWWFDCTLWKLQKLLVDFFTLWKISSTLKTFAIRSTSVAPNTRNQRSIAYVWPLSVRAHALALALDIHSFAQASSEKGITIRLTSAWFIDAGAALAIITSVVKTVMKIWRAVFVSIVTSIELKFFAAPVCVSV